jgi:hypothetical protein
MLKSRKRKKCPPGCVKKPIRKASRKRRSVKRKASRKVSRKRRSVKRKTSRKRRSVKRKVSRKRRSAKKKASRKRKSAKKKASRKRKSAKKKASRKRKSTKNKFRVKKGGKPGKTTAQLIQQLQARRRAQQRRQAQHRGQPISTAQREAARREARKAEARREAKRKIFRNKGIHVNNAHAALMEARALGLVNEYFSNQFNADILLDPKTGLFRIETDDESPFFNAHIWSILDNESKALNFLNEKIRDLSAPVAPNNRMTQAQIHKYVDGLFKNRPEKGVPFKAEERIPREYEEM